VYSSRAVCTCTHTTVTQWRHRKCQPTLQGERAHAWWRLRWPAAPSAPPSDGRTSGPGAARGAATRRTSVAGRPACQACVVRRGRRVVRSAKQQGGRRVRTAAAACGPVLARHRSWTPASGPATERRGSVTERVRRRARDRANVRAGRAKRASNCACLTLFMLPPGAKLICERSAICDDGPPLEPSSASLHGEVAG
jgi:hypothetical protein